MRATDFKGIKYAQPRLLVTQSVHGASLQGFLIGQMRPKASSAVQDKDADQLTTHALQELAKRFNL
jgi:hypothetical protein